MYQAGVKNITLIENKGIRFTHFSDYITGLSNLGDQIALGNISRPEYDVKLGFSKGGNIVYDYEVKFLLMGMTSENAALLNSLKTSIYGWCYLGECYDGSFRFYNSPVFCRESSIKPHADMAYQVTLKNPTPSKTAYLDYIRDVTEIPLTFDLISTGDGSGVATLTMESSEATKITLSDFGKFYSDAAGTLDESDTWDVIPGAERTIYLRCTSFSTMKIEKNKIIKWSEWLTGDLYTAENNYPVISGDLSLMFNCEYIHIDGNNRLFGDISQLKNAKHLFCRGNQANPLYQNILSGNITNCTWFEFLDLAGQETISGSISGLINLNNLTVHGLNTLSGSVANLVNLQVLKVLGHNTIGGSISGLTAMTHISVGSVDNTTYNTLSGTIDNMPYLDWLVCAGLNTIEGDISNCPLLTWLALEGENTLTGSVAGLSLLTRLTCTGFNTLSGSVAGLTSLDWLLVDGYNTISGSVAGLTSLTYLGSAGTNILSGSVAGLTSLQYLVISGNNTLSGDLSALTSLLYLRVLGSNSISGSIAGMTNLYYCHIQSSGSISGSVAALTQLTFLSIINGTTISGSVEGLVLLTYMDVRGTNTLSGSVANLILLTRLLVHGSNTISGSINGLTSLNWLSVEGGNTLSGEVSGLTLLAYCYVTTGGGSTITFTNATNLTACGYFRISTGTTLTSANVNQLLADFWANRNVAKPLTTLREINIFGSVTTGAPTGQGATDKAALQAYSSPTPPGTDALWTVTTR